MTNQPMYYGTKYGAPIKSFECKVGVVEIPKIRGLG